MEQDLAALQRERDAAQEAALLLQTSVEKLTQVRLFFTPEMKNIRPPL